VCELLCVRKRASVSVRVSQRASRASVVFGALNSKPLTLNPKP